MTEIKFTNEEDEHLIELVAKNPPLFDPQLDTYKDGNIRDNIWRDIAEKLKKCDGDCKRRWKYIRDSYNRFKRKRKMSTGSAPPKNSKWKFFERLQFLEVVSTEKNVIPYFDLDSSVISNSPKNEVLEYRPEFSEVCPNETSLSPKPPIPQKKGRKTNQDEFLDYLKSRDKTRQILLQQLNAKTNTDIDDDVNSFGNHVKSILRKLHPRLKIQAKNEIFNILTKYEMLQMDMQEENNPSISAISVYSSTSSTSTPEPTNY